MKRIAKISFSVHPAGAAVLLLALLFLPSQQVLAAAGALLWHEGCHLAAFLCCGATECRIELTPFGGMTDVRVYEKMPPFHQAVCAVAGVAGSCAGAWVAWMFWKDSLFCTALCQAHLSLALVNCLPAWPLDGARVLVSLAACFGAENGMRRLLAGLSVLLGITMLSAALYGAFKGWLNPSLLLAGPYLCYASRMGMAAERVREMWGKAHKLQSEPFLQVMVFASRNKEIEKMFPRLLGQCAKRRYGLLLQLNEKGEVQRIWTEEEMLGSILGKEAFGTASK